MYTHKLKGPILENLVPEVQLSKEFSNEYGGLHCRYHTRIYHTTQHNGITEMSNIKDDVNPIASWRDLFQTSK